MTVRQCIACLIATEKSDVFLRQDFKMMGSTSQVTHALRNLIEDGVLVRISLGVYARAKCSVLTGRPIPVQPISVLAPEVLRRLGIEAHPSRLVREYNEGKSTQVPPVDVVNTGGRRIRRKIEFGVQKVKYEYS